jgi:hypothetical protein
LAQRQIGCESLVGRLSFPFPHRRRNPDLYGEHRSRHAERVGLSPANGATLKEFAIRWLAGRRHRPDCYKFSCFNRRKPEGTVMMKSNVLAIGIEPAFADFAAFPQLTPEMIRGYIDAQIERLRALGYEAESCLIDLGDAAEAVAAAALQSKRFDCVVIGAGLREPPPRLMLFEKIINLVHRLAPHASICFNTTPADTAEAVLRWVRP